MKMNEFSSSGHFIHRLYVAFHETDTMGVVHHSNYVRYFEEARVAWLREKDLMKHHAPFGPYTFAVTDLGVKFLKPAKFDDLLEVWVQVRTQGARIVFQYAIWNTRTQEWNASGFTELVPINDELRAVKPPGEVRDVIRAEKWDETWPPPRTIES